MSLPDLEFIGRRLSIEIDHAVALASRGDIGARDQVQEVLRSAQVIHSPELNEESLNLFHHALGAAVFGCRF
jgi:hypothetical protein